MMDELEIDGELEIDPFGEQMKGIDEGAGMEDEDEVILAKTEDP